MKASSIQRLFFLVLCSIMWHFIAQENDLDQFLQKEHIKKYIKCAQSVPTVAEWQQASEDQKKVLALEFHNCSGFMFWDPRYPNDMWWQHHLEERARVTLYIRALEFKAKKNGSEVDANQATVFSEHVMDKLREIKSSREKL